MDKIRFKGFLRENEGHPVLDAAWIGGILRSGGADLWVAGQSDDVVFRFRLSEGALAKWQTTAQDVMPGRSAIDGAALDETDGAPDLWLWDSGKSVSILSNLGGAPLGQVWEVQNQSAQPVSIQPVTATQVASFDAQGFSLFQKTAGLWTKTSTLVDTPKTAASQVTASAVAEIGGAQFLITGSEVDNGLSVFRLENGRAELVDTIGAKDGLWAEGISDLEVFEIAGTTFVLAISTRSDALISLRLNAQGVFFVEDIVWDTQATRFAGATDLASFEVAGRSFALLGGQDLGLSLFELLPDGEVLHHQSIAQSATWDIGGLTEVEALVIGSEVQIFAAGAAQNGVAQLSLDVSQVGSLLTAGANGGTLSGGARDDLLIGGQASDVLRGNNGKDVLIAGSGHDTLIGGAGADVFLFRAEAQTGVIADYQIGEDKIDLSDWGRLYDVSALTLRSRGFGAEILWGDHVIEVHTPQGTPIAVTDWSADDFIF